MIRAPGVLSRQPLVRAPLVLVPASRPHSSRARRSTHPLSALEDAGHPLPDAIAHHQIHRGTEDVHPLAEQPMGRKALLKSAGSPRPKPVSRSNTEREPAPLSEALAHAVSPSPASLLSGGAASWRARSRLATRLDP